MICGLHHRQTTSNNCLSDEECTCTPYDGVHDGLLLRLLDVVEVVVDKSLALEIESSRGDRLLIFLLLLFSHD